MQSSAYYAAKIAEFKAAQSAIKGLYAPLEDCEDENSKGEKIVKDLIICGEPMDKGKLKNLSSTLSTISGYFDQIIAECSRLISEYQALYEAAKAAEEEAARQAAIAASTTNV
jgi:hypothetical protein